MDDVQEPAMVLAVEVTMETLVSAVPMSDGRMMLVLDIHGDDNLYLNIRGKQPTVERVIVQSLMAAGLSPMLRDVVRVQGGNDAETD